MNFNVQNLNVNPFAVDIKAGQSVKLGFGNSQKTSKSAQLAQVGKAQKLDTSSYSMKGFDATGFNGYSANNIGHAAGFGGAVNPVRTLGIG